MKIKPRQNESNPHGFFENLPESLIARSRRRIRQRSHLRKCLPLVTRDYSSFRSGILEKCCEKYPSGPAKGTASGLGSDYRFPPAEYPTVVFLKKIQLRNYWSAPVPRECRRLQSRPLFHPRQGLNQLSSPHTLSLPYYVQ